MTAHFYHLYAAGKWRDPVAEHLAALEDSGYDGPFHVGLVGSSEQRAEALEELRCIRPPDNVTEADEGWEQVTLAPLRAHAIANPDDVTLYAHTKGAHDPSPVNVIWRRSMSWHIVLHWQQCAKAIAGDDYDAIGCHWLTPQRYPGIVGSPFFGGTYWLARNAYLSRLPECSLQSRHEAESWIGLEDPRVLDLTPGWPGSYAAMPRYRRLIAGRVEPEDLERLPAAREPDPGPVDAPVP